MKTIETFQEFQKACAEVRQTEGFPETYAGKIALPYITGHVINRDVNETQSQWVGRCWKKYKHGEHMREITLLNSQKH